MRVWIPYCDLDTIKRQKWGYSNRHKSQSAATHNLPKFLCGALGLKITPACSSLACSSVISASSLPDASPSVKQDSYWSKMIVIAVIEWDDVSKSAWHIQRRFYPGYKKYKVWLIAFQNWSACAHDVTLRDIRCW